mgnify:CR=1 FL=1
MAKTKTYKCTNYGICTEAEKETIFQETDIEEVDGKFVCPKCGQELEEIKQKPGVNWKLVVIIAAVLVAAGGAVYLSCFKGKSNGGNDPQSGIDTSIGPTPVDTPKVNPADTPKVSGQQIDSSDTITPPPVIDPKPEQQPQVATSYNLGWGTYDGPMHNGKPNGTGVIIVTKTYNIDLKDMSSRKVTVTKGDIIKEAYFKNGKLISGYIHYANKEAERILIGN